MTIKEEIIVAINHLPEHRLKELHRLIKGFVVQSEEDGGTGKNALARLRQIKISGAADLSTKINLRAPVRGAEQEQG